MSLKVCVYNCSRFNTSVSTYNWYLISSLVPFIVRVRMLVLPSEESEIPLRLF
jgi:hypothetical protein